MSKLRPDEHAKSRIARSQAPILLLLAVSLALDSPAQQPARSAEKVTAGAPDELEQFCVIPESYIMRPAVFVLVPGARRVGFTAVRQTSLALEPYTRSELRALRLKWPEFFRKGQQAATRHLQTLTPKYTRDSRKIILYAHFESDHPLTSSILISPEFPKLFANTLGKELYVVIPDRSNVFVFPKHSDPNQKAPKKMAYLYKEALYPVSNEVFEISQQGIRVVRKFWNY